MRALFLVTALLLGDVVLAGGHEQTNIITLPAGQFLMGSNQGMPNERPERQVAVEAFSLDRSPVSVADFARFVESAGHITEAEHFGQSAVFDMESGRWGMVPGATWRTPFGPVGQPALDSHPVNHVSWEDANAYCQAADGRLPTEAEFEYAAKGAGNGGNPTYAFGEAIKKDGDFLVNVFNGEFPFRNTGEDGYLYTAPIGKTGITPLGFTDMAGNVWEWSQDWYDQTEKEKTLRGGSFLCEEDVCHGYRTSARSQTTPESTLIHVGFRCAYDS